jgi:uncharacterized protein YdeI (YjbR/CyaY-like superfamily)
MQITKTLYVRNAKEWRVWLKKNYNKKKEIWLIYYRKSSGRPRIDYNDAVNEALCFGWIDSIMKRIDDEKFAQRFTPRRPKSPISEMNKERVRRMIKKKKMTKAGLDAISNFFNKHTDKNQLKIAPDILKALKVDKKAWKNFQNFSEGYKKVRIGYIEHSRDAGKEIFEKRLRNFIKMTAKNNKFGMVK